MDEQPDRVRLEVHERLAVDLVAVRYREGAGLRWVQIMAKIALGKLDAERALRLNLDNPFGVVALDGTDLVFLQNFYLPAVDPATLQRAVRAVALQAAELERQLLDDVA